MKLPPEILHMACSFLSKEVLKDVRLVCKALEQAAVPFLFDLVFLSSSHVEIERAKHITAHFGPHIRTIMLSFRSFPERAETTPDSHDQVVIDHNRQAFRIWGKARAEHIEIMESGEFLAQLCHILSRMPNAQKMALESRGYGDWKPYRAPYTCYLPWLEGEFCPYDRCDLSLDDHLRYQTLPMLGYQDQDPNPWHLIMLALFVTDSPITEIVSFRPRNCRNLIRGLIPMGTFATTPRLSRFTTKRFSLLTRLRLTLTVEDRPTMHKDNHTYLTDRSVARALSAAVNLQTLSIECDDYSLTISDQCLIDSYFSAILKGCRFPKLRTLVLSNMQGTDRELLDFLEACPRVEHLIVEYFRLEAGSWAALASRIRDILPLKSVSIKHIWGGFKRMVNGVETSMNSFDVEEEPKFKIRTKYNHEVIEDFFLRDGENPFTQEALDHFHANHPRDQQCKKKKAEADRQRRLALYN